MARPRLKITSDGLTTKVFYGDQQLGGIQKVTWTMEAGDVLARATVEFAAMECDVVAETDSELPGTEDARP